MTALALRDDQVYWDENQLAVLQGSGIDEGVTKAELQTFLHECQRRKLDPFTRQIYLIGRFDRRQKRKVYRSQTSIDGFRLIARRAADKAGIDYSYEDTIWFDPKGGRHEIWLSDEPPAGAKVVVVRNGCRYDAEVRYSEYVVVNDDGNATGQWKTRPATMIAKCCEALALRKAFPEDLGGLYTEEEMAQADNPQRVQATAEVIRDEPVNGHARSGHEADPEWDAKVAQMSTFATDDDGRALWKAVFDRQEAKKLTKAEGKRLQDLIKARWAELKAEAEQAAADAEPVEGVVVADLDPDDPWAARVQEITSADDAATVIAEVDTVVSAHQMDEFKAAAILAAVAARENELTGQGALV